MKKTTAAAAFSLPELTIALGVAAFCLIALFGLMPVGVQTNRNATSQTAATNIAAAVIADLRATPTFNAASTQYVITFGTNKRLYFDGTGQFTTLIGANSRYQGNIIWSGSSGLRYADIKVTWPAAATVANANGSVEMFAAFDRN
jgi:Tfp pilus assembly protein PilV